VCVWSTAVGR